MISEKEQRWVRRQDNQNLQDSLMKVVKVQAMKIRNINGEDYEVN